MRDNGSKHNSEKWSHLSGSTKNFCIPYVGQSWQVIDLKIELLGASNWKFSTFLRWVFSAYNWKLCMLILGPASRICKLLQKSMYYSAAVCIMSTILSSQSVFADSVQKIYYKNMIDWRIFTSLIFPEEPLNGVTT